MSGNVEMIFWDVQHGHSTYIKTPNGRHIMIDLGTGDYSGKNLAFSPLYNLRTTFGVQQIDYLIITHPDKDHIDDILQIDYLKPKVFYRPKQLTNNEVMEGVREQDRLKFQKYCQLNDLYSVPVTSGPNDPDNPDNYGGLKLTSFIPTSCSHDSFNNHSIITVLEYAEIKVVVPGDNESCSFQELLKLSAFKTLIKDSHVLLAPHHGRESGFNIDFINLVNPYITIVSDGSKVDTSASDRYSQKSRGWTVHKGNGSHETRKCLTTNSDGEVFVSFGYSNDPSFKNLLHVRIS